MTSITTCTRHEWKAPDGETFSYSAWGSNLKTGLLPRAVVVAVHGLSGAALDFEPLGSHLARHGVLTFALELRGQGSDPVARRRGDLARIEDWFADFGAFVALVRAGHFDVPIYYYGESMGGALLTRFLAQAGEAEQPAGLVLASPVVVVPGKPSWWQQTIFRFFLCVRPTHRIDVTKFTKREDKNDPSKWVTRDEAHRRWFETAPHKLDSYTVRFFKCLFDLIGGCMDAAPRITVPALVIYAAHDVFIPPARVEEFFARLGSREKELQFFPESYHLLLHDHDRSEALARIEDWLLRQIEARHESRVPVRL
jgi:acylglycerol lipase